MDKKKTLGAVEFAISETKKVFDHFVAEKDDRGIFLNQGRLEQLIEFKDIIESGKLDV